MASRIVFALTLICFSCETKVFSQDNLLEYLSAAPEVKSFDGLAFKAENNGQFLFTLKGENLQLDLADTIPYKVFNRFVNEVLYPRRPKKLRPKILLQKSETQIDSIPVTDVGVTDPYELPSHVTCTPKILPILRASSGQFIQFILLSDVPEAVTIELYNYDKLSKRILSYIPLFRGEKYNKSSCEILGINQVASYQTVEVKDNIVTQIVNDGFNGLWRRRLELNEKGYYEILWLDNPINNSEIFEAKIEDPDGFTNVRRKPDTKSEILYRILANEKFKVRKYPESNNWYKVFDYKGKFEGWIHRSRVKLI